MTTIDLNCDLGEGFGRWTLGDDEALLDVVTSANIACGFHAGDPASLLRVCRKAAAAGVVIGAQVGYRDLVGFGRRFIDISYDDLLADVIYQIGALAGLSQVAGAQVRYVKPHGALYHAVDHHEAQATAVVDAVRHFDAALLGRPGSLLLQIAESVGIHCITEGFADRRYGDDGLLIARDRPGAVLTEPAAVVQQALSIATGEGITSVSGRPIAMRVQSLCLHGDTPGAPAFASAVRRALTEAGVVVQAFCGSASTGPHD